MATFTGDATNNTIVGLAEDDTILGLGGADSLSGLAGADVIDGGSGGDSIDAGAGDDTVTYVASENTGVSDNFDGGLDSDTLRVELTSTELNSLISDLRDLDDLLTTSPGAAYSFTSVDLDVVNFETLEVVVDGVQVDLSTLPGVFDDSISVLESEVGGDVDINVLTNDDVTPVALVNGDAGNVGVSVAGTNGGLFTINADGETDFSANGEFEALGLGESATTEVTYGVEIQGVTGKYDIILTQDLSGSFSDDLPNVRTAFDGLFDALTSDGDDVGFGVASFIDKPISPFGSSSSGDYPYLTDQSVSTDKATTQATLDGLITRSGSDSDESQLIALQQIALRADSEIGFRSDAQRFVVLQTDADPHVAGDFSAAGPDDGDTDTTELEDYPTVASVGALLNAANISVIFAISPQQTSIAAYQTLLADLGVEGTVVPLSPNSSNLSAAIQNALDTFTSIETATLTATVTGENDLPDAIDDAVGSDAVGTSNIDLTGNDSDPDTNDDLEILSIDDAATLGTVVVNADNDSVTYDPNGAFVGLADGETAVDTFEYTVTDGNGGTDTATVSVTVTGGNELPVAAPDSAVVGEDDAAPTVIDLTGNDSDPDGTDDLEILSIDDTGTEGTVTVNPDNDSVTYDPAGAFEDLGEGETEIDTFTYTVTDGNGGTDTETVSVTVTGANDLPVAVDDAVDSGAVGTSNIDLTGNDSDPDTNDDLEILSIDDAATLGTVVVNADNDSVTYDPNGAFVGLADGETAVDTFEYTVTDGNGGTDTATVSVTVTGGNELPVAAPDSAGVGEDDAAPTVIDLTGNDSDPDGTDDLEILSIDDTGTEGTVTVNPDNDSVTYDPAGAFEDLGEGETEIDTFTYTVTDGNGGTDTETVSVTVTGANDLPVAVDDAVDSGAVGTSNIDLTGNDSDPDTNDDLEILSIDDAATLGTVVVNADNDSVTYDPNGAFVGLADGETAVDTFEYTVTDGNGGTDTATVSVTVTGGNELPVAAPDSAGVGEDDAAPTVIDLTGNDSDPDGTDDLEILSIDDTGTEGTVTVNADNDSVTYDPAGAFEDLGEGETEIDTFTYTVTDGNGGTDTETVSVTVTGANDLPVAVDDAVDSGAVGTSNIDLTGNDSDPDTNDDLEILSIDDAATLGTVVVNADNDSVTYDPNGAFVGLADGETAVDTFEYTVTDGNGGTDTATVSVTVTGGNELPVAAPDSAGVGEDDAAPTVIDLTGNDSDPDGTDDLEILSIDDTGTEGTVTVNADNDSVTYDPAGAFEDLGEGETEIDTFTYTVTDGNGGTDTETVSVTVTGANDLPVAVDDAVDSGAVGTSNIDLTGNDSDPDTNDDLEILSIDDAATLGTVVVNADNDSVTYDPNGAFVGLADGETAVDTFEYTVTDGNGGTDTATVSVTVTGGNELPVAAPDSAGVGEDDAAPTVIDLTGNDSDPDGTDDLEILSIDDTGTEGTVTVNPDNDSVTYDPAGAFEDLGEGETEIDTFTYTVTDGNGGTDTETVSVTVTGANDLPVAVDDAVDSGAVGTSNIDLTGNDSDPDTNDDLEILSIDDAATLGTVVVNADNDSVTYDPNGAFVGLADGETAVDTFEYTVTDGNGGTDTATVSVTVTGGNELPVAAPDSAGVGEDDAAPTVIDLTGNDSDPDGTDDLEILSIDDTGTEGTVTVNPDNDSVTYDPAGAFEDLGEGETEIDTFTYTVTDGNGGTDTETVSVTVTGANDLPVAVDDAVDSGAVGTSNIDLTGNDSDPDTNDDLEILSIDDTGTLGTVVVNADNDSVTYDPNGAFVGLADGETAVDTFEYTVTDGNGGTDTATVSVTVTGGNELPVAAPDSAGVGEDDAAPTVIDLTGNDSDPDGTDDLEILSIDDTGTEGTVTVNPDNDSVTYDPAGAFEDLGEGETEIDTFTYTVTDGNGGTDTETVSVTVTGANDLPVAVDDAVDSGAVGTSNIDLTGNDSDPDTNDDLEILSIDDAATLGTVVVNADNDSVTYDPNGAFVGLADGETAVDTFEYTVTDGNGGTDTATVSVTVTGGNELPVAAPDSAGVGEDDAAPTVIDLTGNDSDPDGTDDLEILSIDDTGTEGTVTVNPDNDSVTYDPAGAFEDLGEGETEIDTFTYTVTDGNGGTDTETVSVTVTGANDLPVAVDDAVDSGAVGTSNIDLTGNDSDPDTNDDLEILSIDDAATLGTVVVNADNDSVTYDPNGAFVGLADGETAVDTFEYTVTDGNGGTDTATVSVTVTGGNELPVAAPDSAGVGEDDAAPTVIDLTGNDSDPDGTDDLEILSIDDTGTEGTVTVNPDNDSVTYDPAGAFEDLGEGETEIDTFTYTVTDGNGGTDTETVSVTVTGANDTPVAVDDAVDSGAVGTSNIDLTGNDSDPDTNDDLEILSIDDAATLGTVVVNADNDSVTYDPNGAFVGLADGETAVDTFEYTVTDGNGGTDTATVSVTVTGGNELPVAAPDSAGVGEDDAAPTVIDLTGNDSDPDGTDDLEILSIDDTGTEGTVTVNPDNDSVTYDPAGAFEDLGEGETEIDTFTYTVTDGNGGTDTETVSVTVTGANDLPVAVDDAVDSGAVGTSNIDLTGNDSDPDTNDDLEILSIDDAATLGTVVVNADNDSVTYDPNGAFVGLADGETAVDTFEYTVTDGNGGTDTATVSVTVTGGNELPVAAPDSAGVGEDDAAPTVIDLTGNDSDPDGDDLEILSIDDTGTEGTVTVNADNDSVTYDPAGAFEDLGEGETEIDTFTYTVTDGNGGTDTETVSVTVTGANDLPVAVDDAVGTLSTDIVTAVLTSNDSDPDTNDDLEILSVDPSGLLGLVTIDADNDTIAYDPNGAFDGLGQGETDIDTFTYTITDGNGGTDTATVSVTVTGVNDPPVAVNDSTVVGQGQDVTIDVLVNDSDPNLDTLTVIDVTDGNFGASTINADGTISFVFGQAPSDVFTYTISDGRGGTDTAEVTVSQNFAPVLIEPVVFGVPEGTALAADLNHFDAENDDVTYSIGGGPDGGFFTIDSITGELNFTIDTDFENPADQDADNTYLVDITVTDAFGSNTQEVEINITNDPADDLDDAPEIAFPVPQVPFQPVRQFISSASTGVITDVQADDDDLPFGDTLTFSLFGEDADQFDINSATGEISLLAPLTDPFGSFDGDAIYEVIVVVEDSTAQSDTQAIDYLLFVGG